MNYQVNSKYTVISKERVTVEVTIKVAGTSDYKLSCEEIQKLGFTSDGSQVLTVKCAEYTVPFNLQETFRIRYKKREKSTNYSI